MPSRLDQIRTSLKKAGSPARAKNCARFFKTAKGQYGHGDIFLGITVPVQRKIAYQFLGLGLTDVAKLLASPIHEHRFAGLEILVAQYKNSNGIIKEKIVKFYLRNTKRINNWDLVDTSAPYILGEHLATHPRHILYRLAKSENLWERRIAIVATQALIRRGDFTDTFKIAEQLLKDKHDLIHRASGWMLREVGKRDKKRLVQFLKRHYMRMPRTMLRYAIERLDPAERKHFLAKIKK